MPQKHDFQYSIEQPMKIDFVYKHISSVITKLLQNVKDFARSRRQRRRQGYI